MYPKVFLFLKFKNWRKNISKSTNFFVIVLYTKRRCEQIEPQLKVETEDGREAPKSLVRKIKV